MNECFSEHSSMEIARMKYDKEIDAKGKNGGINMERSKVGTKKISPNGLYYLIKIQ